MKIKNVSFVNKNTTSGKTGKKQTDTCPNCSEYLAGWKRALADYDNLQKGLVKERARMRHEFSEEAVHMVLPVLENFDQALKFKPEGLDKQMQSWLSGILHVRAQLEETMKGYGAEPFCEVGEHFDPNRHDASQERSEPEQEDQTILEVLHRGWTLNEKIIRPAQVIVNNLQTT